MSRRRFQLVAVLFIVLCAAEVVFSVVALSHRHSPTATCTVTPPLAAPCHHSASRSHQHFSQEKHFSPEKSVRSTSDPAAVAPASPVDSPIPHGSSEDDCSICKYLAQLALPVPFNIEFVSQDLSLKLVQIAGFDVADPAYLLPQPRSPPAVV